MLGYLTAHLCCLRAELCNLPVIPGGSIITLHNHSLLLRDLTVSFCDIIVTIDDLVGSFRDPILALDDYTVTIRDFTLTLDDFPFLL